MTRKTVLIASVAVVVVAAGAVVAWLAFGKNYIIEIEQAQLQKVLDDKFPIEKTYLSIIVVEASEATVTLEENSEAIGFAVSVGVGLPGISKRLRGSAELSGRVRYVPDQGAFYVDDLKVKRLSIDGLPDKFADKTKDAIAWIMKDVLERWPVYTLRPDDVKHAVAKLLLKDLRVAQGELRVTLGVGR